MQAKLAGYLPMRRSLANDPSFDTPETAHVKELVTFAGTNPVDVDQPENTDALQETISRAVAAAITGKQAPEQALKEAKSNYNSMR